MRKLLGTALIGVVLAMSTSPAAAFRNDGGSSSVAYNYILYADAEKTVWIGMLSDTCGANGGVINPYLPTPYFDREPAFLCTSGGPYLPPEW
ncbi:hypothetical protein [Brevundimonas terrae]|uniref:hypothetical protein n=1 Tax=Brevundimonas terrae TaxID=363631 RepID=UPI001423CB89|nr:hypothetical protein [Brevundimonas terrae]